MTFWQQCLDDAARARYSSAMTKAQAVLDLLQQSYLCHKCGFEERRLQAMPGIDICLSCATPHQLAVAIGSVMRLYVANKSLYGGKSFWGWSRDESGYIYGRVGGGKYSAMIEALGILAPLTPTATGWQTRKA